MLIVLTDEFLYSNEIERVVMTSKRLLSTRKANHIRRFRWNETVVSAFQLKDQLLSELYSRGHFPYEGTEKEVSTLKCLTNCSKVNVFAVDKFWCRAMYI
ncbi:hypothetical protein IGI04_002606, partial [Brassica rapa subsp. trilocularis]